MLTKKEIEKMYDGQKVTGLVVFQSIEERPTRNQSSSYLAGNLQCQGAVPFKIWSNAPCFMPIKCSADDYKGVVCQVNAKVNVYEGQTSLVIETCTPVEDENAPNILDFYESKYDAEVYWTNLYVTLQKNCSKKALEVFDSIIKPYKEAFMVEFAAISHHDNCKSGLLGHTTKLVKMEAMLAMYPNIISKCGGKDVLYIGGALHDIGKVVEYSNGSISGIGLRVSHMILGAMIVSENEKIIVDAMGEEFYLNLIAIVSEHAGEYGERPRTVGAYVIHLLDMLESRLTSLNELSGNSQQFMFDGFKLI